MTPDPTPTPTSPYARYRASIGAETLSIALGTAAFFVGLAGEMLLFKDRWHVVGALTLGVAAVMAAVAWRGVRDTFQPDNVATEWGNSREIALRLGGIGASILLFVGGLLAWFAQPDAIFGLQGVLWICSIALLAVSCWGWAVHRQPNADLPWTRL